MFFQIQVFVAIKCFETRSIVLSNRWDAFKYLIVFLWQLKSNPSSFGTRAFHNSCFTLNEFWGDVGGSNWQEKEVLLGFFCLFFFFSQGSSTTSVTEWWKLLKSKGHWYAGCISGKPDGCYWLLGRSLLLQTHFIRQHSLVDPVSVFFIPLFWWQPWPEALCFLPALSPEKLKSIQLNCNTHKWNCNWITSITIVKIRCVTTWLESGNKEGGHAHTTLFTGNLFNPKE